MGGWEEGGGASGGQRQEQRSAGLAAAQRAHPACRRLAATPWQDPHHQAAQPCLPAPHTWQHVVAALEHAERAHTLAALI